MNNEKAVQLATVLGLLYRNRGTCTKGWLLRAVFTDGIDHVVLDRILNSLITAKLVIENNGTYQITPATIDLMAKVIENSSIDKGEK